MMFLSVVHNRKLSSQKLKIRPQRDSSPQSPDSKSDALTVRPFGHCKVSKWIDLKRSGCRCFFATAKMINFFSKNYLAEKLHAVNHDVFICCA